MVDIVFVAALVIAGLVVLRIGPTSRDRFFRRNSPAFGVGLCFVGALLAIYLLLQRMM